MKNSWTAAADVAGPIASQQRCPYNVIRTVKAMDSKYLKIAFILIFASFALVTVVFVFVLLLTRG